jgi:deoxyribodipyrimidine photolyase
MRNSPTTPSPSELSKAKTKVTITLRIKLNANTKNMPLFPPTRDEALARIASVRPAEYARTRNALSGAVTQLSPYITHGFVSLPEVFAGRTFSAHSEFTRQIFV